MSAQRGHCSLAAHLRALLRNRQVNMVKGLFRTGMVAVLFLVPALEPILECHAMSLVPEGLRAMTIRVSDENAKAAYLHVGACIDVSIRPQSKYSRSINHISSTVLLRNIRVFAVGFHAYGTTDYPKTITLLVTPQQAETLIMGSFPPETFFQLTQTSPIFLPPKNPNYDPMNSCLMRQVEWREMWIEIYDRQIAASRTNCKYPILDPFSLAHP